MTRVWIDTDVALGAASGDVDDGFAIAAIAGARDVDLIGVSTVFGNTGAAVAADCARRLLDVCGRRDVAVVEGAARRGERTRAADAIAALPDGCVVLALGPLTNVAAALHDARVGPRLRIHLVGGNLSTWGRWPPIWPFEFNLAQDPEASAIVFSSAAERVIHPLDVLRPFTVGARELAAIAARSRVGAYLAAESRRWLRRAPLRYQSTRFPPWDLVPALGVLGRLTAMRTSRRLRLVGRGRLVDDAAAPPSECVTWIDGAAAGRAFLTLF